MERWNKITDDWSATRKQIRLQAGTDSGFVRPAVGAGWERGWRNMLPSRGLLRNIFGRAQRSWAPQIREGFFGS